MPEPPLRQGWRRVRFGDVVRLVTDRCSDPAAEGIERYVGLEHIDPEDLRVRRWGHVAEGTTFTSRFRPGHVLFGKRRAYQRKVALVDFQGVCSGDIYVLESREPTVLLPNLLPFLCQTEAFFDHALRTSAGSLSPRTNWTSLADFEFALPPLDEQRRAGAAFKAAEAHLEQLLAVARAAFACRQSIGQMAFAVASSGHARPDGLVCRLGDAVVDSAYGPRFPGSQYSDNGNVGTVRTTDFAPHGQISLASVPTAQLDEGVVQQHRLRDGDFLLSRSGEYAGMVRVFREEPGMPRPFIPAAFLVRFRLDTRRLRPDYLFEYCESPIGSVRVRALARGSAQPNISASSFVQLEIPCPDMRAQARICATLQAARSAERAAVQRCDRTIVLKKHLLSLIFGHESGSPS